MFSPNYEDDHGSPSGLAYGVYRFQTDDYADSGRAQTIGLDWDSGNPPTNYSDLWVGLANWDASGWDWYAGPADGVLTLSSLAPYTSGSGETQVMILMTGSAPATLDELRVGDTELRGTGALDEPPSGGIPPLAGGGNLPWNVDLTADLAPISDQGTADSSSAFAAGDGAFSYELGQIYGTYGWDLANPFNRISPKYVYVESGKAEVLGCPDEGRHTSVVATGLAGQGAATEHDFGKISVLHMAAELRPGSR